MLAALAASRHLQFSVEEEMLTCSVCTVTLAFCAWLSQRSQLAAWPVCRAYSH